MGKSALDNSLIIWLIDILSNCDSCNIHYIKRYVMFVCKCHDKNKYIETQIEKHHILPKSVYPEYIDFNIYAWNEANLTPRQHYIAHYMLAKAIGGKMWYAIRRMTFTCNSVNDYRNSKIYEMSKKHIITEFSINNPMKNPEIAAKTSNTKKEYYKNNEHHRKGANHKEESKKKISEARKKSNGMKGKFWITDGYSSKPVSKHEDIPEGWTRGFTDKSKDKTPSIIHIYNPFGFLIYGYNSFDCSKSFKEFCEDNDLPHDQLRRSVFKQGKPIKYVKLGSGSGEYAKRKYFQYWYAIRVQSKR